MTAPFEVSRRDGRAAYEPMSALHAESLRGQLLAGLGDWNGRFAQDSAMLASLTANPSEDPTSINRAMAALHMYRAIEAIEEIEDALERLGSGQRDLTESRDRHPSSIRYANWPFDPARDDRTRECSRTPERDAAAS